MTKYILARDITTGLTETYPEEVVALFSNLEPTTEDADCKDCYVDLPEDEESETEEIELKEPVARKKK